MRILRGLAGAGALACVLALASCVPAPAVSDIEMKANDLQGETVKVGLDQTLYVNTGDLDVESYTAEVADDTIVEFMPGHNAGDFSAYPGFTPLTVGSTRVTMTNDDGGIQPLEFTIEVTAAAGGAGR